MGRRGSESPFRDRRSPRRKSPSRSERSPARHRNTEQPSIHKRSPRRARSRSPREKAPSHTRSPQHRKSVSPVAIKQKPSSRARSPKRAKSKSPPPLSLSKEKPSNRTRSPKHARSRSPELRKLSSRARSPKHAQSRSPESGSPSPRTKRLRRAQAGRDDEKGSVRNHEKNRVRKGDGATHRERDSDRNQPIEGKDRSGRDEVDNESSRVRRERSSSPSGRDSSPSPRTKRLKRAQAERDDEKGSVRNHEKNRARKGDGATHRERDSDRNQPIEIRDRSGRDEVDNGSSRVRRERPSSPSDRHYRSRQRSRSPRPSDSRGHDEVNNSSVAEQRNGDNDAIAKMKATEESLEAKEKVQKPSFELSGKLAEETNRVRGITLLFTEPPEARKPEIRWRLYVFKGGEVLNEPLYVHRLSCYLFGRERRVADIPTDHPSCSKQHAVLQYRQVEKENPDGTMSKTVKPYLMDLGSTNGTFINDNRLEPQRYYELFEKDTIKFGNSSREYVLLHENSSG